MRMDVHVLQAVIQRGNGRQGKGIRFSGRMGGREEGHPPDAATLDGAIRRWHGTVAFVCVVVYVVDSAFVQPRVLTCHSGVYYEELCRIGAAAVDYHQNSTASADDVQVCFVTVRCE